MARWADESAAVHVAFLADGVSSRTGALVDTEELQARRSAAVNALQALGLANEPQFFDYPDNRLDTVPLLDIAQQIEALIAQHAPHTVLTHHAGDVNIDHQCIHQAVVTACRPQPRHPVRRLLFFEVASSTEWQPPDSGPAFRPNVFVDIHATLDRKLEALRAYEDEMRPWPHARSVEAAEHHARWRGASIGCEAAEAFMLGREII
jgi:LmbE family N-acetylglucosaminyl deacetylase